MDLSKIHNYILAQLNTGLSSQDIVTQLRQAGWDDASIQAAFSSVAAELNAAPTAQTAPETNPPAQTSQPTIPQEQLIIATAEPQATQPAIVQTLPPPLKRGRLKIGWLLFKQSLKIIKSSPGLLPYVAISIATTIALELVFFGLLAMDFTWWHVLTGDSSYSDVAFYGSLYLFTLLATFVTYFFTVALSAHLLAIFRGKPTTFSENISIARRKIPAIVAYTIISTTVGFILRQIEERFQLLGKIISLIFGALWSLLTTFTLPVIADTDKGGVGAIKESFQLFKANWGQTITSRVVLSGLASLFYLLIIIPVTFLLIFLCAPLGIFGFLIPIGVFVLTMVAFIMLVTMATNTLNVCLYYYARYNAIPPSFDPELLASVFVEKKSKKRQ
jgi:hypothetical protein